MKLGTKPSHDQLLAVVKTALFFGETPRIFSGQCSTFVGGIEETLIYLEERHLSRKALRITQPPIPRYRVFPTGKAARAWRLQPTPSSSEDKEYVELYLYSPSGYSWPVLEWNLLFTLKIDEERFTEALLPTKETALFHSTQDGIFMFTDITTWILRFC